MSAAPRSELDDFGDVAHQARDLHQGRHDGVHVGRAAVAVAREQARDARVPADFKQEGGRIVVNFAKTSLPESLMQRLDVTDFATPVNTVDQVVNDPEHGYTRALLSAIPHPDPRDRRLAGRTRYQETAS